jgi:alpha-beta hydrolase superfamily lysophospholipase
MSWAERRGGLTAPPVPLTLRRTSTLEAPTVTQLAALRRMGPVVLVAGLAPPAAATAAEVLRTLPPTRTRPAASVEGKAPVNGVELYHAEYGQGQPVILLHGGLASSDHWGDLIPALSPHYRVIVLDSRGHGRRTRDGQPRNQDLMASDVVGLMDYLKIPNADIGGRRNLGRIPTPVAIADGEHDEATRSGRTEQLAKETPGARLLILPGVSHFPMLQNPAEFDGAVLKFLAG